MPKKPYIHATLIAFNNLALEFIASYPEIKLELVLSDRIVDSVEESVDPAIR
jgi:hypothetical protein